jgi:hypothetical protein
MKAILKNWKTTILGIAVIAIKLFAAKGNIDAGTAGAIVGGVGLILAHDGQADTSTGN